MVEQATWEDKCCRCDGDVQVNVHPGKRACHLTCGPCVYPGDWQRCVSCEMVGHCAYALDYLKNLKPNGLKKGCHFTEQLSGEETLYHIMNFVNGEQQLIRTGGEKAYIERLRQVNLRSPCLRK